jgi:hypothetical protein
MVNKPELDTSSDTCIRHLGLNVSFVPFTSILQSFYLKTRNRI